MKIWDSRNRLRLAFPNCEEVSNALELDIQMPIEMPPMEYLNAIYKRIHLKCKRLMTGHINSLC